MPRVVIAQTASQSLRSRTIRAVLLVEAPALAIVAAQLARHYSDGEKVSQLVDHGHIQALGPELGRKHPFDLWQEARQRGWTTFYGRDRDGLGCEAVEFRSTAAFARWCEEQSVGNYFIHTPDGWRYADPYARVEQPIERLVSSLPVGYRTDPDRAPLPPTTFRSGNNVLEYYVPT